MMRDPGYGHEHAIDGDWLTLDRDVRTAATRLAHVRALCAAGSEEARQSARHRMPEVWRGVRHVSTMATYRALTSPSDARSVGSHTDGSSDGHRADRALRDGLARWVYELLQARVSAEFELDECDASHASHAADAHRGPGARRDSDGGDAKIDALSTYAGALASVVRESDEGRAEYALQRAASLAGGVAAARRERQARRVEAARRLHLAHPLALATKHDVQALALAFINETDALAADLRAQLHRRQASSLQGLSTSSTLAGGAAARTVVRTIHASLARDASEGWPARLSVRWLEDVFGGLVPRAVRVNAERVLKPFAAPLGGASFLRAAVAWGVAWRKVQPASTMPFALAADPYPALAWRLGYALANAVASPAFQQRALGLSLRRAKAQSRSLRVALFMGARMVALRTFFEATLDSARGSGVPPALFEEMTARVFRAPLPDALRDAWPSTDACDAARLLGLLRTLAFAHDLTQRFDDDWYRNPKAGLHLVSLGAGPAFDDEDVEPDVPHRLARVFEEALG